MNDNSYGALLVNSLHELLPLRMWQLLHAGLVSELGVSIDVILNRKDPQRRFIHLQPLPESERVNPFCAHLRKWRSINRGCFECQTRILDDFVEKDRKSGDGAPLPYVVSNCHMGLFRVVCPLRIHKCTVAFVVAHAIRQAGNEGLAMIRLRNLEERLRIPNHREALLLPMALPQLAEVRGFSPKSWAELLVRLRSLVADTQKRLGETYGDRCAAKEEEFLAELSRLLPGPEYVKEETLKDDMDRIAEAVCDFCNLKWFAYFRRSRPGERLSLLGSCRWRFGTDVLGHFDCPPLEVEERRARPLGLLAGEHDRSDLEELPSFSEFERLWHSASRVYIHPQRVPGVASPRGTVDDMLLFGPIKDPGRSLVEGIGSKRSAFEKITRHLSARLDALYHIIYQHQFVAEMSHEMSATANGILVETSHVYSLYRKTLGISLPAGTRDAFDLLRYYVKQLDHKRRNWLYSFGTEGKPTITLTPCDLGEILTDVINIYKHIARQEGIDLRQVAFSRPDLPAVEGYREWIESVFANLLDNAIKYTERSGYPLFQAGDLRPDFLRRLRDGEDPMASFVRGRLVAANQDLFAGQDTDERQVVAALNRLITGSSLWDTEVFADVRLSRDSRDLIGQKLDDDDQMHLNKLILEDAFFGEFACQRYIDIEIDNSHPKWFRLSVSNFGIGIRQEWINQGLIWRAGWRLPLEDIPEKRSGQKGLRQRYVTGTGIGCNVVKQFMEAMRGKVAVESHKGRYPRAGSVGEKFWSGCKTTFTVEFPKH